MSVKVAIVSDLHYAAEPNPLIPKRRGELAAILLLRAVHRFNRFIKPDIVLVTGDLINQPDAPDADVLSAELRDILALLKMPYIVIPGNHDLKNEAFYRIFPRPAQFTDIGKVRFVTFDDPETPGYNALRTPADIEFMRRARAGWTGPLVSVQHVPLLPRQTAPYNYDNSDELLAVLEECGYTASVSGHYHNGLAPMQHGATTLVTAAATCETPFPYSIMEIGDDGKVTVQQETLSLDPALKLRDCHIHTPLAYCNENMSIPMVNSLADAFGLAGTVTSEHSAHLYFDRSTYVEKKYYREGVAARTQSRIGEYLTMFEQYATPRNAFGMEIDFDHLGRPVIEKEVWDKLQFRNGAVHFLNSLNTGDMARIKDEFMFISESILKSGVDALVHPFRILNRLGRPTELYEPLALLLKKYRVAAEINFHTNEPEPEFFRLCLENGVKITLGSDSHNLYEVGEFYPHLKLLDQIAPGSAATDIFA